MKILFKIVRSIITSLLFILLILTLSLEIIMTFVRTNGKDLRSFIRSEDIYDMIIYDEYDCKDYVIDYIDSYFDYVFYKRSYPNTSVNKLKDLTSGEVYIELVETVKNSLDLEYNIILKVRDVNNFISNGSIYLLVTIIIFSLYLCISLARGSFLSGIKYLGMSLVITSLLLLIMYTIFVRYTSSLLYINIIINILRNNYLTVIYNLLLRNTIIGFLAFSLSYSITSLKKN